MLNRSASLAMSTGVLKALPGKLDIKRHSPSILYISASLAMSASVLKALPGKLDIKRHSPSILYISASLAMSASVLKALPGKLDIKRHSPSILYLSVTSYINCIVARCLINIVYLTACCPYQVMMTLHFLSDVAYDAEATQTSKITSKSLV